MKVKIWEKLLIKQMLQYMGFFLLGLYCIYVSLDLSTQSGRLIAYGHCNFWELIVFYLEEFIIRFPLLLPLSFLLALIKVIGSMNTHNELTALYMAGVGLQKIVKPLFFLATFFTLLNLCNEEFWIPLAQDKIDSFQTSHLKKKKNKASLLSVSLINDNSKFIYQKDSALDYILHDVFWIRSDKEIWHMKKVDLHLEKPLAHYVDIFQKDKNGYFMKTASLEHHYFDQLVLHKDTQSQPLENRSLHHLLLGSFLNYSSQDEKEGSLSHLFFKIEVALFPLLMLIATLPFCLKRSLSLFFLSAIALFGFIGFYTFLETSVILGENQVFSPYLATLLPFLLFCTIWIMHFRKCLTRC